MKVVWALFKYSIHILVCQQFYKKFSPDAGTSGEWSVEKYIIKGGHLLYYYTVYV